LRAPYSRDIRVLSFCHFAGCDENDIKKGETDFDNIKAEGEVRDNDKDQEALDSDAEIVIIVSEDDQKCSSNSDCSWVSVECAPDVPYGTRPVNSSKKDKYEKLLEQKCKGIEFSPRPYPSVKPVTSCDRGLCIFSGIDKDSLSLECEKDEECGSISTECSGCDCPSPINLESKDRALNAFGIVCEGFSGAECDQPICPDVYYVCVENKCIAKEDSPAKIEVLEEDKNCSEESECGFVRTECNLSIPDSLEPVNSSSIEKYDKKFDEMCGVIDLVEPYLMPKAGCDSGKCIFVGIEGSDTTRECEKDEDCGFSITRCDQCDCGSPINKNFQDEYMSLYGKVCADYSGGVCDVACEYMEPKCVENLCDIAL